MDLSSEFVRPLVWIQSWTATATPSNTAADGNVFRRPMRVAFGLLRLSLSPETACDRLAKIFTSAAQLAATTFPTFVTLDSSGPLYAQSGLVARGAVAPRCDLARQRETHPKSDPGLAPACAKTPLEQPLQRADREEIRSLIDRGLYAAAIAQVDRVIAAARPSSDQLQLLLVLKGQLYYSLNDIPMSVKLLDQAISADPDSESGRRALNAKYEVARLLQKRTTRRPAEPSSRAAIRTVRAEIVREPRLRVSAPTILALRSTALSQANLTLGVGIRAANQVHGE